MIINGHSYGYINVEYYCLSQAEPKGFIGNEYNRSIKSDYTEDNLS